MVKGIFFGILTFFALLFFLANDRADIESVAQNMIPQSQEWKEAKVEAEEKIEEVSEKTKNALSVTKGAFSDFFAEYIFGTGEE